MSAVLIPRQTEQGWIIEIPPALAESIGVTEGSFIVLYPGGGSVTAEILPPLAPELADLSDQIFAENHEFYAELKRLGD